MTQGTLIFHDTVPLPDEQALGEAHEKARTQQDIVLEIFRQNPQINFTPFEIMRVMEEMGYKILITSVRRSITNLTREGRLRKCDYSDSRVGEYKTINRTWKYNSDYLPPLNPKK